LKADVSAPGNVALSIAGDRPPASIHAATIPISSDIASQQMNDSVAIVRTHSHQGSGFMRLRGPSLGNSGRPCRLSMA
jgi:hypothetical protein